MPEFPDLLSWSSTTQNYLYYHQIHVEDNMLQIKINQNGFRMVAFKDRCMIINYQYPEPACINIRQVGYTCTSLIGPENIKNNYEMIHPNVPHVTPMYRVTQV